MATTGTVMYSIATKIDGVAIEQVDTVPLPAGKINKIDLSNQDSGFGMEFTTGRFDPGDVTIHGIWTAGKPGITALKAAANDRRLHNFEVDLPDGTIITFVAYVGTFRITDDKDRAAYEVDLTVNGIPLINTSYAALTTPFFAVATSTSIIPAPSATNTNYVVNVATGTSTVTITPTDATAGATIYVNDTAVTTGSASGAITLGSATSLTPAVIRVCETGKADAYYFLTLARA